MIAFGTFVFHERTFPDCHTNARGLMLPSPSELKRLERECLLRV